MIIAVLQYSSCVERHKRHLSLSLSSFLLTHGLCTMHLEHFTFRIPFWIHFSILFVFPYTHWVHNDHQNYTIFHCHHSQLPLQAVLQSTAWSGSCEWWQWRLVLYAMNSKHAPNDQTRDYTLSFIFWKIMYIYSAWQNQCPLVKFAPFDSLQTQQIANLLSW